MQRLAAGDHSALALLVDRWQRPLLAFTFRYVQDHDAAHELTQETFVRVYQHCDRFKPSHKFSSWIFKIAANLCKNYFRWKSRHPEHSLDSAVEESGCACDGLRDDSHPADAAERSDTALRVARAVDALPHGMKVAVLLHYYDSLSYRNIAAVIGCSERGVETRLYRARAWLAERLGIESNSGGPRQTGGNTQPRAAGVLLF